MWPLSGQGGLAATCLCAAAATAVLLSSVPATASVSVAPTPTRAASEHAKASQPPLPPWPRVPRGKFPALWFGSSDDFTRDQVPLVLKHSLVLFGGAATITGKHEEAVVASAARLVRAAGGPHNTPPILGYRNAHVGLPYYDVCEAALADPAYDDMWVRNASGEACEPSAPLRSGRFYDWRNSTARDFFVDAVVGEAANASVEAVLDGVFFDEANWATCGFLQMECGDHFSSAELQAFWEAQVSVLQRSAMALAAAGKYAVLSLLSAMRAHGSSIDGRACLHPEDDLVTALHDAGAGFMRFYGDVGWYGPNATADMCNDYVANMVAEAAVGLPLVIRGIVPATNASLADLESAIAPSMMALGDYVYIGASSGWDSKDWEWWPDVYDRDIGGPRGPATRVGRYGWVRDFDKVRAEYDCESRQGTLTWHDTHGVVSVRGSKGGRAVVDAYPQGAANTASGGRLSLEQAQVRAREHLHNGADAVDIVLHAGVHTLRHPPLAMTAEDSGTTLRAHPAESEPAIISGGAYLAPSAFSPVPPADPLFSRLPNATATLRADVSSYRHAFTAPGPRGRSSHGGCGAIMELFDGVAGAAMTRARWPNTGQWAMTEAPCTADGFGIPANAPRLHDAARGVTGLFAAGYFYYDWSDATIPVNGTVVTAGGTVALVSRDQTPSYVAAAGSFASESRFFLLNQPEYLDAPGEYFIDTDTAMLYVIPTLGASRWGGATVSVNQTLVSVAPGATGLTFDSLTLVAAQQAGIECAGCGATNVTIRNCTLRGFGVNGIAVSGGTGWRVLNSTVADVGATAVGLSGGNATSLAPSQHILANSTVTDFSRTCWTYEPGVKIAGVGVTVANNEVAFGPHQAVLWGGNDHTIERNVLHDVVTQTFDSAAVYASDRDWAKRGTVMRHNLIVNVGNSNATCNPRTSCHRHAIYLDALSDGFTVEGNVLVAPAEAASQPGFASNYGVFNNGGRDDSVTGNMCVGYGVCVNSGDCGLTWFAKNQNDYAAQFATLRAAQGNDAYVRRYPALAALDASVLPLPLLGNCSAKPSCAPAPWGNTIQGNMAVGNTTIAVVNLPSQTEFPSSRFNYTASRNRNYTQAAALFASPAPRAARCWALQAASPLYKGGDFQRVPLESVGTQEWQRRWPCGGTGL